MAYVYLLICLLVIVFSANWLVAGAVVIAQGFKISDFVIGVVILGVGTSFPELVVSSLGAFEGNPDIAIGNVVGSNIFNILAILGVTALVRPVVVTRENTRLDLPISLFLSVLTLLLVLNFFTGGTLGISRIDGIILLLCFAIFMFFSLKEGKSNAAVSDVVITDKQLAIGVGQVVLGLAALIISSRFFLDNAIIIAHSWGVNDAVIAITLVACGTSLPELAASITAARKKNTQMALGNVVGSNIFNIALILGVSSQLSEKGLTTLGITMVDYGVMIFAAILPWVLGFDGILSRKEGAAMVVCFVLYNIYLLNSQMHFLF